jgi:hypothetical protein
MTRAARWVLLDGTRKTPKLLQSGEVRAPRSFNDIESLRYLREKLKKLMEMEGVNVVSVRDNDAARGTKKFYPRVRVEALALEAAASEGKHVLHVAWPSIAAALGVAKQASKKKAYKKAPDFRGIDCNELDEDDMDAVHAAVVGLKA